MLSSPVQAISVAVCCALSKRPKVRVVPWQAHVEDGQHLHSYKTALRVAVCTSRRPCSNLCAPDHLASAEKSACRAVKLISKGEGFCARLNVLAIPFAVPKELCNPVIVPELSHICWPTVCLPRPSW